MSQAAKILSFLIRTRNHAADQALLLAWRRAEEPYRSALLECLLDRGQNAATLELIKEYHSLSPSDQQLLCLRIESLYGGLFQAGRSVDLQTRLNALTIIHQTGYLKMADLVVQMLRDHNLTVRQKAGLTLLTMARRLACWPHGQIAAAPRDTRRSFWSLPEGEIGTVSHPGTEPPVAAEYQAFRASLARAVADFSIHRQSETLLAAMALASAQDDPFWQDRLAGFQPVGRAIRQILPLADSPEAARFAVSALAVPTLRITAAKVLSSHTRPHYVLAMAQEYSRQIRPEIRSGLKLIRDARWLQPQLIQPDKIPAASQLELVLLVRHLHVAAEEKAKYLAVLAREGLEATARRAIAAIGRLDRKVAEHYLYQLVADGSEPSAKLSLAIIQKRGLQHTLSRLVHLAVQGRSDLPDSIRHRIAALAFARYRATFDRLDEATRRAGGRALFKMDSVIDRLWLDWASDSDPRQRLRALQMARLSGPRTGCRDALGQRLRQEDPRLRSFAAACLADYLPGDRQVRQWLQSCLHDPDPRVRANALEALGSAGGLEGLDDPDWLVPFVGDDHPRIRANAVKALLQNKVQSAQQAIRQMLADPRPDHRRSARWVANQLEERMIGTPIAAAGRQERKAPAGSPGRRPVPADAR